MAIRTVVLVAVLALVAAACGGDDDVGPTDEVSTGAETDSGAGAGGTGGLFDANDPAVARAGELAVILVDQLGDDDTAFEAVARAGDAGYDAIQIEAAIVGAILAPDGSIAGVVPSLAPFGLLARAEIAAQGDDEDLLPIEQLRREAAEEAGLYDHWPSGAQGTAMILSLQLQGYSQSQIVDILILGAEVLDGDYEGPIAEGEEECGGFVIGGVHEIPQFCDPDSGELYPDEEEKTQTDEQATEPAEPEASSDGFCDDFAPPYTLAIEPAGVMLETEILGPLETPYYYAEVAGFVDIGADGSVALTANTTRLADITIRGAPDNQIYIRELQLTGSIDLDSGDGEIVGTGSGTDQLWADDSQRPVSGDVSGQVAVVCEDGGVAVFGFASGSGGLIEFEARP